MLLIQVLLLLFLHITLGCDYNAEDKRAQCHSFEELSKAGEQTEWNKLNVVGKGEFLTVNKDAFSGVSNVFDLQIKAIASILERGTFMNMKKLHELHLDDNKLGRITAHSFENPVLETLFVYNCEVTDLQPQIFENIPNLKYVFMYGNKISSIRKGVFNNLPLRQVSLRKNKIRQVELEAFTNMSNLEFLSLEENELTYFETNLIVGFNSKLEYLYINRNKISEIRSDMFATVPNLKVLLLNINQIEHIGEKCFADLKKLFLLDLSSNKIKEIRPDVFPAKDSLIQILFLHENRLTFISSGALVRLPKLKQISASGNPWQCSCYDHFIKWLHEQNIKKICDKEIKDGERPSCLVHLSYENCVYDLENNLELIEYYEKQIKDYPKLPPVCNVDGHEVPTWGD